MVQLFRLQRFSLRLKIPFLTLLSLIVTVFGIGISAGITSGAPLFSTPVQAAQGRYLTDVDMHTRKDGLTFLVGTSFNLVNGSKIRNQLSLTVLNNGNPNDSVNADFYAIDVPQKYPSIAFSPVDGTGYIAFRTKHGGGFLTDLREIPPAYNGTTNKTLGRQITLDYMDQPTVVVDSAGNINLVGKVGSSAAGDPVRLQLVKMDRNFNVLSQTTLDTQASGQREEMDPIACIDTNDNIHVVSQFPITSETFSPQLGEFAYSRVSSTSFVKTNITPSGWINLIGGKAKDIACAPDGTVYVAVNNRGQLDLYKRTPGAGGSEKWAKTFTNVFQIYADSVAVTVGIDGKVWVSQADGQDNSSGANAHNGANVKFSTDGGFTFSANELAIPNDPGDNKYVAIDANPVDNKVHLIISVLYGYSTQNTQYAFATSVQPPSPPTNLTAVNPTTNQITLNWTPSVSSPSSYKIYRSTAGGPFTLIAQGVTGTTFNDTNLTSATTYYYKMSAVYFNIEGDFSNVASATTLLGAPTGLSAIAVNSSRINLSWTAPFPAPDSYIIFRSTSVNGPFDHQFTTAGTTYADTGLNFGTTYFYKVESVKAGFANSADSNLASATTLAPASVIFTTQPSSGVAGAALTTQPAVKVVDVNGATVSNYNGPVTLTITPATGNPAAALTATTNPVTASSGLASFSGVTIDAVGLGYKLRATVSTGASGDSAAFNQTGTLVVTPVPGGLHATDPFMVTVTMQKTGGVTDTKFNGVVNLTYHGPNNNAYNYGMTAANVVNGVATFKYLMIDTADPNPDYYYTASLNPALAAPVDTNHFSLADYATPVTCTRYMVTNAVTVGTDIPCSQTSLSVALGLATAQNPKVPVYIDHRATGLGTGQVSFSQLITIPDGAILDGGCTNTGTPQGLLLDNINNSTNALTIQGNNHYLRGIYFRGYNGASALLKPGMGNTMSCDKVVVSAP